MALGRGTANSMKHWMTRATTRLGTILLGMSLSVTAAANQAKAPAGSSTTAKPSALSRTAPVAPSLSTSPAPSRPGGSASSDEEPLPKPGPRGPAEKAELSLPPFLGFFGSAELIRKTGFRSQVGSWIQFNVHQGAAGGAAAGTLRIQQVGPSVRGGRWLEILVTQGEGSPGGVRLLARGEEADNMERVIALAPGFPPMDLPLDTARLSWIAPGAPGEKDLSRVSEMGELRHVGREVVEVPLGKFNTDRWEIVAGKHKLEFWITADTSVPFTGMVKARRPDGEMVATAVGTDATAVVPVPQPLY